MGIYTKDTQAGIYGNAGIYGRAGIYSPGGFDPASLDYFARAEALDAGAFALDLTNSYESDFSVNTDGWGGFRVSTDPDQDGVGGLDDNLLVIASEDDNLHALRRVIFPLCEVGQDITGTFEVFIPASNSIVTGVRVGSIYYSDRDQWITIPFSHTDSANYNFLFLAANESLNFAGDGLEGVYVRNVRATVDAYATATESYTKAGIDAFIRSLKGENPAAFTGTSAIGGDSFGTAPSASDVWDKITELYNLGPVSFGAITAKLKHAGTATLTNNNFVSGDHVPVGAGGGLKGNGASKQLKGGITGASFTPADFTQMAYHTVNATGAFNTSLSMTATSSTDITTNSNSTSLLTRVSNQQINRVNYLPGLILSGSNGGSSYQFQNGGSKLTGGTPSLAFTGELTLYSQSGNFSYSDARIVMAGVGTGLTDAEAARLSWCVNSFATYFGSNTYVNA